MRLHHMLPVIVIATMVASPALGDTATAQVSSRAPAARHDRFEVALSVAPGYGTYFSLKQADNDRALHGVWVNLGLDLSWGDDRRRVGLRVHGMWAPTLSEEGVSPGEHDYYRAGGVYASFVARFGGFWFSPGIGLLVMSEMEYDHGAGEHEDNGTGYAPEFNLGLGYTADINDLVALKFAVESGTSLGMLWRFQLSGGVELRF